MIGVAGQKRVPDDHLRDLEVRVIADDEQRRIADYLDAETARIDEVIAKKEHFGALVEERLWAVIDRELELAIREATEQPLSRFTLSACDGPFGSSLTSAHYVAEGARVLRLGNLGRAAFKDSDQAFIDLDYYQDLRRHEVRGGDLLIAGLGDDGNPLGRACVAPEELGPAIVKADCFRLRLTDELDAKFAALWLSSSSGGAVVQQFSRGSTRQRVNLATMLRMSVPIPSVTRQRECADRCYALREAHVQLIGVLTNQIDLLREQRQALITAAVTGQLDIPGAAA